MAYTIYLGSVDKRVNSTKRPDYTNWASYSVVLKTPTDYDKPVFTLQDEFAAVAPLNYNYAVAFGRYYWITGLRAIRTNIIEISLTLDIFASRRDEIMDTEAFIEYGSNTLDVSSSVYRIPDTRRPVNKNPTISSNSADITGGAINLTGHYIMQCIGANGGVSCFALTSTQLRAIMTGVNTDIAQDVDDIMDDTAMTTEEKLAALTALDLKNSLLAESAFSAIKAIHWLPLSLSTAGGTSTRIYLGRYDTGISGLLLANNTVWTNSTSINIPWPATDWRRGNCQGSIYIPFFGTIPLPVDQCLNRSSLTFRLGVDHFSGDASITVWAGDYCIYTGSTNISAPFAVGQVAVGSRAIGGAVQALGGAIETMTGAIDVGAGLAGMYLTGGLWGGDKAAGGVQSIVSGAGNTFAGYKQMIQPVITSAGSLGGLAGLGQSVSATITVIWYPTITDTKFESLYGHPVMHVEKPVLGFCKTRGFSIALKNEPQYISIINAAMDGGMFIE